MSSVFAEVLWFAFEGARVCAGMKQIHLLKGNSILPASPPFFPTPMEGIRGVVLLAAATKGNATWIS